jgi:hypothetical protein
MAHDQHAEMRSISARRGQGRCRRPDARVSCEWRRVRVSVRMALVHLNRMSRAQRSTKPKRMMRWDPTDKAPYACRMTVLLARLAAPRRRGTASTKLPTLRAAPHRDPGQSGLLRSLVGVSALHVDELGGEASLQHAPALELVVVRCIFNRDRSGITRPGGSRASLPPECGDLGSFLA